MFESGFKDSSPLTNAQHMQLHPIFLGWAVIALCTSNCMSVNSYISTSLAVLISADCEADCAGSF